MWLAEAGGLRVLFDPLLAPTHHGGVFDVTPARQVDDEALRPDFVFVSHRHPDHFDVPSLHALAQLDPDTVVVTSDALVVWAANALGFSTVREVPVGHRIELDGLTLVTTPSLDPREWGAMVAADGAVVWNQVDTVFRDAAAVRRITTAGLDGVGESKVTLALARWQPMLEIAAALGRPTQFPHEDYAALLLQLAAVEATALVPSACGGSHVGPYRWLDRHVFPLTRARFLSDFAALGTQTSGYEGGPGACFDVRDGTVTVAGVSPLVAVDTSADDPRVFEPLSTPALVDPGVGTASVEAMRETVQHWIERRLCRALEQECGALSSGPLRFVVSVVWPTCVDAFTVTVQGGVARCVAGATSEWDALNEVAGSMLWEVLEGHRNWGDVLLAGCLRARTRAYEVTQEGLAPIPMAEIFLYYALSYDSSVERAVRWEVGRVLRSASR